MTTLGRTHRQDPQLEAPEAGTIINTQLGVKVDERTKQAFQGYAEIQLQNV